MDKFFIFIITFFIGVVLALATALLDAAVANWLLNDLFPRFGYWDWFRICFVAAFVVSTSGASLKVNA